MPNPDNEPQIPKNQSSITDDRTGMVSRDWYRFFLNLLNKANTGGGGTGTVTSINVSGGATGLTTSGGPVTTSGTITLAGTLDVDNGGTGATTATNARTNLSAAKSGANTDITSVALTSGTISTAPSVSSDIVNKLYADSIASGVNFHAACQYATTTNITATYNNGSSGVGATLSGSGLLVIDGHVFLTVDVGTRVLIKNQTNASENGVYVLTSLPPFGSTFTFTRATDYDTSGSGTNEIDQGDFILIINGTANANTSWVQQTPLPITVGTTDIVFIQFGSVTSVTSFSAGSTGFTPNSASSGTVTLGGTLGIANGGTNATTAIGALTSLGAYPASNPNGYTNNTGTVTSVNATVPSLLSVSGVPITTSGTIAMTYSGTPLPIANGGTNATTSIAGFNNLSPITSIGDLIIGNGTNSATRLGIGTNNQVLTSNGTTATWAAVTATSATNLAGGTTGAVPYQSGVGATTFLSGNTGTTPQFVTSTGTGTVAQAPTLTNSTGSGSVVLATSPTLTTPTLGVASATTINKVALTAPATGSTLTIADGKTFTASNSITVAGTDSTTMTFPPASASIGYLNLPINSQSAAYTTVLSDSGKAIFHPSTDANFRTFTIDSNTNVAYATGTQLTFINMSAQSLTIAITSDTLYLAGVGTTGSRLLGPYGVATATKMTTTTWLISGSGLIIPPSSPTYLVVAGGGGSGTSASADSGAGGAGGFLTGTLSVAGATSYTVTVGGGGAENTNGTNSVFSSITSTGGGKGGTNANSGAENGSAGGSGGGGAGGGYAFGRAGGAGTAGQGNTGGAGVLFGGSSGGGTGGGGGAGAVGAAGSGNNGGNGGVGLANPITGSTTGQNVSGTYYLAGGGGGTNRTGSAGTAGTGGNGGGGAGSTTVGGTNGTANTGGGAGGGQAAGGGIGGSGVVILSYASTFADLSSIGAGLTYTKSTSGGNTIYTFTAGTGLISW